MDEIKTFVDENKYKHLKLEKVELKSSVYYKISKFNVKDAKFDNKQIEVFINKYKEFLLFINTQIQESVTVMANCDKRGVQSNNKSALLQGRTPISTLKRLIDMKKAVSLVLDKSISVSNKFNKDGKGKDSKDSKDNKSDSDSDNGKKGKKGKGKKKKAKSVDSDDDTEEDDDDDDSDN
jgi:hypothetical protein